jgi:hypothetical protein
MSGLPGWQIAESPHPADRLMAEAVIEQMRAIEAASMTTEIGVVPDG